MAADDLAELEAEWERRFKLEPKLPSAALLTAVIAMALAFGAVMFFCFAWATGWRQWVFQAVLFLFLSIMVGLINRWCARRWYKEVEVWSAERRALMARIEAAKSK